MELRINMKSDQGRIQSDIIEVLIVLKPLFTMVVFLLVNLI